MKNYKKHKFSKLRSGDLIIWENLTFYDLVISNELNHTDTGTITILSKGKLQKFSTTSETLTMPCMIIKTLLNVTEQIHEL